MPKETASAVWGKQHKMAQQKENKEQAKISSCPRLSSFFGDRL